MTHDRTRIQERLTGREVDLETTTNHSAEELFIANYDAIRSAASKDVAGVSLVAVDTGWAKVAGAVWMAQRERRHRPLGAGS